MLSQRMGGQADIWRDEKLRGNDIFSDEIVDQLPKTASNMSKKEWLKYVGDIPYEVQCPGLPVPE